jgi:hypothetical protein
VEYVCELRRVSWSKVPSAKRFGENVCEIIHSRWVYTEGCGTLDR